MLALLSSPHLWLIVLSISDLVSSNHWSDTPLLVAQRVIRHSQSTLHQQLRNVQSLSNDLRVALEGLEPLSSVRKRRIRKRQIPGKCSLYLLAEPSNTSPADPSNHVNSPETHSTQTTKSTSTSASSSGSTTRTSTRSSTRPSPTPTPHTPWNLTAQYRGEDFFNQWDYFVGTGPGGAPNSGLVQYLPVQDTRNAGLAYINDQGNYVMRSDTNQYVSPVRRAVRITARRDFTGGLVILDAIHVPTGCGAWPAFWSNGPGVWPGGGEIDIFEGVHDQAQNQVTLHTSPGCTISSSNTQSFMTGQVMTTDCQGGPGCSIRIADDRSYGKGFNDNGGGVYALNWDDSGISVWFFPRSNVPSDISQNRPNTEGWGLPAVKFPASSCSPFQYFGGQTMIMNINFCGDLAAAMWHVSGYPGQEQSCAQRTGYDSCEEFVLNNGGAFEQAYWEVSYVKVYRWSG